MTLVKRSPVDRSPVVNAARPVLERLQQAGMYLSSSVVNRALQLVDE